MWADNIKFVKDIIDGKYQKIDSAANEVCPHSFLTRFNRKTLFQKYIHSCIFNCLFSILNR